MDKSYAKIRTDNIENQKCRSESATAHIGVCKLHASGCSAMQWKVQCREINCISVSADHAHYPLYLSLIPKVPTFFHFIWNVFKRSILFLKQILLMLLERIENCLTFIQ